MKEIVVISGKGGTGKTSITAALSYLAKDVAIIADCDVDAADMHLLLQPDYQYGEDFYSGVLAEIDQDKCIKCGKCKEICRFNAIKKIDGDFIVKPLDCEGCGYCSHICPRDAISMISQNVGKWYRSNTRIGTTLIHAALGIGAENSGKLVAQVKKESKLQAERENKELILVDGSPGIGCPVVSSLSGADYVLLVTEATTSGLHDLQRIHALVKHFKLTAGCIINKADLNNDMSQKIKDYLQQESVELLGEIPYDESFSKAMIEGKTIVEHTHEGISETIQNIWNTIKQ